MNSSTVHSPTMIPTGQTHASELCSNLVDRVGFDDIPNLDIVEILDADSAFIALLHLTDVVLEAAQRPQLPFIDHHVVANHSDSDRRTGDRAVHHMRSRNDAGLRHHKDLSHFGPPQRSLL